MLGTIMVLISTLLTFALEGLVVAGIVLLVVRLIQKKKVPPETAAAQEQERKSLAEALKEHRLRCGMIQEFVAESLGVSRQAVSKWGKRHFRPQHHESAGPGKALRRLRRGTAESRSKRKPGIKNTPSPDGRTVGAGRVLSVFRIR